MTGVRARWLLLLALGIVLASAPLLCADEAAPADDQAIAASLAKMLQAARSAVTTVGGGEPTKRSGGSPTANR